MKVTATPQAIAVLILMCIGSNAWALREVDARSLSCLEMVRPVDSNDYIGTSEDFKTGFSTLYRDRYTDTTQNYYEGIGSHPGVDITHDKNGQHFTINTPVRAICEGVVERVTIDKKKDGGWGNSLIIRHEAPGLGTFFSIYAHLDRFIRNFSKGDLVSQGEQIGFVGTTGNSTGVHLHFQIDNAVPLKHPFFPNRGCSPACSVNIPDDDRLVADRTFSPLIFVQQHLQQTFPNPTIISDLKILQPPPYQIGDTITAEFTITNKGIVPITFDALTAGGRDPDDQVADFSWVNNITLEAGQSYIYSGTLTLSKAGNYHFFTAYKKDGQWNTSIPTDEGITNTLNIVVEGGPLVGKEIPISVVPGWRQGISSVAYDSINKRFFIVWQRGRGGFFPANGGGIYGQFVGINGSLVGPEISIAWGQLTVGSSVAYDPINQYFLVVWFGSFSVGPVYGQLVGADGSLIGNRIQISTTTPYNSHPSAAYDPINQRFFVAWSGGTSSHNIYGRFISGSDGSLIGTEVLIRDGPGAHGNSFISYDPVNQQFLVIWQENAPTWNTTGQRVGIDGSLLGSVITISNTNNQSQNPHSLSYDPVTLQWLVAWKTFDWQKSVNFQPSEDIRAQRIGANGILMGGEILITTPTQNLGSPWVGFDEVNKKFLVVWQDARNGSNDIHGQLVGTDGFLIGNVVYISEGVSDQLNPSIAYDPVHRHFLVTWEDFRNWSSSDGRDVYIYGQLVSGYETP